MLWKNHYKYSERSKEKEAEQVFNLKKVSDVNDTISKTFEHMSILIHEVRDSLNSTFCALFNQNEYTLSTEKKKTNQIQHWVNVIIANVFKSMRLLQKEDIKISNKYGQIIRRLQKLSDGHRDIVMRSYEHISNHHKGLLDIQIADLMQVRKILSDTLEDVETILNNLGFDKYDSVIENDKKLRKLAERLNEQQIERFRSRDSKTRLTILYYSLIGNAMMLSKQNIKLIQIFAEIVKGVEETTEFDLD